MTTSLLVPCGDPAALAAALASAADALVLDLGGPCAPGERAARRGAAVAASRARRRRPASPAGGETGWPALVVRLAALASGLVDGDLDAVMAGAPDAVLLPGAVGARDIQNLAAKLAVREAERGLPAGRTGILAAPADTARGLLALATVPDAGPRLAALVWDPAALAADLGVEPVAPTCGVARALLLAAAAAARVPALDASPAGRDAVEALCAARRDGFSGRLIATASELAGGRPGLRP